MPMEYVQGNAVLLFSSMNTFTSFSLYFRRICSLLTAWLEFSFSDAKMTPAEERITCQSACGGRLGCQKRVMGTPHKGHSEGDSDSGQNTTEHRAETFSRCSQHPPCAHGQINSHPNTRVRALKVRKTNSNPMENSDFAIYFPPSLSLMIYAL